MSYRDPPPPPYPVISPPNTDGYAGGFWPQFPLNSDNLDSYSQFEQPNSFKRHGSSENNPTNPITFPPRSYDNAGCFWPQVPKYNDNLDSYSHFEQPPPFKRPRNSENDPSVFMPPVLSNPRMDPTIPPVNRGTAHIFYKTRICTKFKEGNCKNGDSCTFAHGPEDLREPPPNWQELVKDRGAGIWNDDQKIIYRMKICKKFYNGEECPYGERCNFLHEPPAKFRTEMSGERQSSGSFGTMGAMERRCVNDRYDFNKHLYSNSDAIQVNINANLDALRVNENAHSDVSHVSMNANSDALHVSENANSDAFRASMKTVYWKTKICSKWEVGMCSFGERCPFAHGQSDLQVLNGRADQPREVMMNGRSDPREVMMNGRDEPRGVMKNGAGGSIVAYPSAVVTISDVPPISNVAAPIKEGGEAKKGFAKWYTNKKINRIYGDWIDDLSPPRDFPSQVDN